MTENEALKTLEDLQRLLTNYRHISKELTDANGIAIKALEEIPRYRDLGTIDELAEMQVQYNYLSSKIKKYESIGTVEECRTAVERMKPRKPSEVDEKQDGLFYIISFMCPACNESVIGQPYKPKHCKHCGQALDWSE